jgi:hypothetical protein
MKEPESEWESKQDRNRRSSSMKEPESEWESKQETFSLQRYLGKHNAI